MAWADERKSLISSQARIQVPWIKIEIGNFTLGVFSKSEVAEQGIDGNFYKSCNIQYPNYVKSLEVTKINGQVNQYTLTLNYGVTQTDDPNLIEKMLSSVSSTRKIKFSYGDAMQPNYIFKDEEAIITKVSSNFQLQGGIITYTIYAVSGAAMDKSRNKFFKGFTSKKPSEVIRDVFNDTTNNLTDLFTAMNSSNIDKLIPDDDKPVQIYDKHNISPIDYISYLVSCMVPAGYTTGNLANTDIYVMSYHDGSTYDDAYLDGKQMVGSYFKIDRMSNKSSSADAFEINVGFGNSDSTIVTNFSVTNDENYALMYEYATDNQQDAYKKIIDNDGHWQEVWAPTVTSKNSYFTTRSEDITWWAKVTQYPIKATITIQGLLKPALLMSYLRVNVIFVGGHKHIASGLYMITKQKDLINEQGYKTTLELTKIAGDTTINP